MTRVMIIGQPGAGKSTLARKLGARLDLPVIHLDHIHWMSGWEPRPLDRKVEMVRTEEEKERWIIEGGLSATWETRLARAHMLVWIDVGWPLRLQRVLARSFRYRGQTRPDLPPGCPEQFNKETLPFLHYIWRTRRSGRQRMAGVFEAFAGEKVRLTSFEDAEAWLATLNKTKS